MILIRFGAIRRFKEHEALMRQGQPSLSIHFILDGQVSVERQRRND